MFMTMGQKCPSVNRRLKTAERDRHIIEMYSGLEIFRKRWPEAKTWLIGEGGLSVEEFLRSDLGCCCDLVMNQMGSLRKAEKILPGRAGRTGRGDREADVGSVSFIHP